MYSYVGRLLLTGVLIYVLFFLSSDGIVHLAASIMLIGSACNFLAIASNDGRMPVKGNWKFLPEDFHIAMTIDTKFSSLCDVYCIKLFRRSLLFSRGDLLVLVGILLLLTRSEWLRWQH
jgi:hypothetical protein